MENWISPEKVGAFDNVDLLGGPYAIEHYKAVWQPCIRRPW